MIAAAVFSVPSLLFLLYMPLLRLLSRMAPFRNPVERPGVAESASNIVRSSFALVTVASRRDARLARKLAEFERLAGCGTEVEIFVGLDGDEPPEPAVTSSPFQWVAEPHSRGKNALLKRIHARATADVLVFSDVDAQVEPESLTSLLQHFDDADVGAVTGRRSIGDDTSFGEGQAGYSDLDSHIRALEMRCFGSVTSCDGKLYAIRRSCIDELPEEVTDDLYTGLGAVAVGLRLVSEPGAVARIGRPARDVRHELERRRRVTCRGLATLWHRRELFDPRRQGRFAFALFVNKLLRRLAAPFVLLSCIALVAALLSGSRGWIPKLTSLPVVVFAFVAFALVILYLLRGRLASIAYLALGTVGMALGVIDYIGGRRVRRWEPRKQEATDEAVADHDRPRLAYLVSHYPKLTETFIVDEVRGFDRDFDLDIRPISPGNPASDELRESTLEHRVMRRHPLSAAVLRDASREAMRSPASLFWLLGVVLRAAPGHPRVALKTLVLVPATMALAFELRKRPVRLIYAGFASYAATMSWMIARLRQVPFAFVAHANDIFKSSFLLDEKVRDAVAVIAISRYNKEYLLQTCASASSDRIHVVPTGVDCARYAVRARVSLAPVPSVLSIGSLLEKKGHAILIDAIATVRATGQELRCRIVGEGPERAALERQIERLGLKDAVELLGGQSRERIRSLLDESDLFVLACVEASDGSADGIPVALMEAMASGLPVVSTRLRAIPELVEHEINGLLCEPGRVDEIASQLLRLIQDTGLRETLARAARERIENRFDQRRIVKARSSIITDTLDANQARDQLRHAAGAADGRCIDGSGGSVFRSRRHR